MSTISVELDARAASAPRRTRAPGALATLARRRARLTARNPRQVAVALITPILFVLVIVAGLAALQVAALIGFAVVGGADFHVTVEGTAWFLAAALGFTLFMAGVAETLAGRIGKQEEYVATTPAIAVVPWFFAGALF